ncbi:MAG: hypothetical protein LBC88_10295 [Spirochaetaceae bacterium]|jgi:galactose mutarotase-like enzyme|nr:hypothetical protein [Spirochaetaceae bacterium]
MKAEISNGQIAFAVETFGAEPWKLGFCGENLNYIWRPRDDPERSGGTSLCFPLLGAVPGGKYRLDNKEYEMETHGFAQRHDFAVVEKRGDALLLEINETPETLARFPFSFRFQVFHQVEDRTLKTEYRVKNKDPREMFFSVGGHPRFSCPVTSGADTGTLRFSDYSIVFDKPEPPENIIKSYGPLETIRKFYGPDKKTVGLDYGLFENGCFCYNRARGRLVTLKSEKDPRSVAMMINGNAYFQLWTSPGSPFIAMEPWYGSITALPPNPQLDNDWRKRPGTIRLPPGGEYTASYDITITGV